MVHIERNILGEHYRAGFMLGRRGFGRSLRVLTRPHAVPYLPKYPASRPPAWSNASS